MHSRTPCNLLTDPLLSYNIHIRKSFCHVITFGCRKTSNSSVFKIQFCCYRDSLNKNSGGCSTCNVKIEESKYQEKLSIMTSAVTLRPRKCQCTCHASVESDRSASLLQMVTTRQHSERQLERNPYLIEWEEFLNRVASRDGIRDDESTASGDSEDDIIPDEEDRLLRFRMLQRQIRFGSGMLYTFYCKGV